MRSRIRANQSPRLLLVIVALVSASVFCTPSPDKPPGEGPKAEQGYAACAPIIAALEAYHHTNGVYPDSLTDLMPDTIAEIPAEVNDAPIIYRPDGQSYALSFSYIGPGMNLCVYSPERDWSCSGAY